jgi:pyruvate kinase
MRRAKIVCTLGPATSTPDALHELVRAGMDVARLNLSHGTYADHEKVYAAVRAASDGVGRSVAVLVDLQGPKIRLGNFASGPVLLREGDIFTITTDDVQGPASGREAR